MFFFEKKNQKTFESLSRTVLQRLPEDIKVFCFFFFKKEDLFFACLLAPPEARRLLLPTHAWGMADGCLSQEGSLLF